MNKFWEWMEKKGYAEISKARQFDIQTEYIFGEDKISVRPTEQMLIGYKIEHLEGKNIYLTMRLLADGLWFVGWKLKEKKDYYTHKSLSNALDKAIEEVNK